MVSSRSAGTSPRPGLPGYSRHRMATASGHQSDQGLEIEKRRQAFAGRRLTPVRALDSSGGCHHRLPSLTLRGCVGRIDKRRRTEYPQPIPRRIGCGLAAAC
jgi:hypothetical protein